ncbi:MAG: exodeoxyribonuclease VII large subunit [Mariprofundales bacterium]
MTTATSKILTVSALTANIKLVLEQGFSSLQVRGEVSRFTRHASGHLYFTVKDANAAVSAVIWRSTANRLRCQPEEGGQFVFHGHLSLYAPRGSYQLVVRSVSPAGEGALAAAFERRKQEWATRGWFDGTHKRPLPDYPLHVGIVTSPTAAALEDIRKVLQSRPRWLQLTLSPALVQGEGAPASIVQAMARMVAVKPDLILLVRGGGSMEDLWCFNDEAVVRAVVESPVPVISGIGHEIDTTLTDLAADLRAATPSNAAELCCPDRTTLAMRVTAVSRLRQLAQAGFDRAQYPLVTMRLRHQRLVAVIADARHHQIMRLFSALSAKMSGGLRLKTQWLADRQKRLRAQDPHQQLRDRRVRLQQIDARLHHLSTRIQQLRQGCRSMALRMQRQLPRLAPRQKVLRDSAEVLRNCLRQRHHQQQQQWMAADQTLRALDPRRVLERGFVMVNRDDGGLVTSSKALPPSTRLQLRFSDGTTKVEVVS